MCSNISSPGSDAEDQVGCVHAIAWVNSALYTALCPFLGKPKCSFSFDRDETEDLKKQEVKCRAVPASVSSSMLQLCCVKGLCGEHG